VFRWMLKCYVGKNFVSYLVQFELLRPIKATKGEGIMLSQANGSSDFKNGPFSGFTSGICKNHVESDCGIISVSC
jgi:hypothetical protein